MKLNLVTLAVVIIGLSLHVMYAPHLHGLHGALRELRLQRQHFCCL